MSTPGGTDTPDRDSRPDVPSLAWVTVKHDDAPDVSVLYELTDEDVPVRNRWLEVESSAVVGVDKMR